MVTYLILKPGTDSTGLKVFNVVLPLIRPVFTVTESAIGVIPSELRVLVV